MKFGRAEEILLAIRYKNWKFVIDVFDYGVRIEARHETDDADEPRFPSEKRVTIHHGARILPAELERLDDAGFVRWVFENVILMGERHEMAEFFHVAGAKVYDPHAAEYPEIQDRRVAHALRPKPPPLEPRFVIDEMGDDHLDALRYAMSEPGEIKFVPLEPPKVVKLPIPPHPLFTDEQLETMRRYMAELTEKRQAKFLGLPEEAFDPGPPPTAVEVKLKQYSPPNALERFHRFRRKRKPP